MKLLRQDKEKKRKMEIERIENKKNEAIRALTKKHEQKYADIKEYYSEITNTNMDIIKQLKDDMSDALEQNKKTQREKLQQEERNAEVALPLEAANKAVKELLKKRQEHLKCQSELKDCQATIKDIESRIGEKEWEYEVKLQQMQYLEREKAELYDEFHRLVYELHKKTGLRNLILEKKVETILEANETKDAQINQILAAARIDPQELNKIRNSLEEVENSKNFAIREIQNELKKIREAHSNMVKTYEGKLSEFGIPVEELGFDPLVPANI